jgi:hypothetical protein
MPENKVYRNEYEESHQHDDGSGLGILIFFFLFSIIVYSLIFYAGYNYGKKHALKKYHYEQQHTGPRPGD